MLRPVALLLVETIVFVRTGGDVGILFSRIRSSSVVTFKTTTVPTDGSALGVDHRHSGHNRHLKVRSGPSRLAMLHSVLLYVWNSPSVVAVDDGTRPSKLLMRC